jgi:hypothetical protein
MMQGILESGCRIEARKQGEKSYKKVSYPLLVGQCSEIQTARFVFQYDLNGAIKYIRGRSSDWPHPSEWLKRTMGNHWVYYFAGGYTDIADVLGEYYLPCVDYPTNTLWSRDPFRDPEVQEALAAWQRAPRRCAAEALACGEIDPEARKAAERIAALGEAELESRARRLKRILGSEVSVLPPDSRHVDYDCLPLILADGCLYGCRFCRVKSGRGFAERSRQNIREQLQCLREHFGAELANRNALFLGLHDGLNCSPDRIVGAAEEAWRMLGLDASMIAQPRLFLFGSVDSLLRSPERLFEGMDRLPFTQHINIGLESGDQQSLDRLGKPLCASDVHQAFERMLELNRCYERIEVTANFVSSESLPESHWDRLEEMLIRMPQRVSDKGTVYLSPLETHNKRFHLRRLKSLKRMSRLPVYLYLILRL